VKTGQKWGTVTLAITAALIIAMQGCSAAKESAPGPIKASTPAEEAVREIAMKHFVDGSIYELKGEYAQSVLEYQDALRYVKDPAIYFALSKGYSQLNKHALAIDAAKESVRLSPENLVYRRNLAGIYAAALEVDAAAAQYEEIVKRDSNSVDIWYNLARIYQARKPLQALEVYEKILDRFGPEWEVLLQIAELNNSMGKFDKAAQALQQMAAMDPGNMQLKRTLAQTYVRAQKLDEALAVYKELRDLNPENLEYLSDAATVHLLKREFAEAAEQFEEVLSRDTVNLDTKLHIGEVYVTQLEKDSSLAPLVQSIFERIREKHPEDWRAYWFLGVIGAAAHNDSLAIANLTRVTDLANWNPDGWVYLASVLLDKNKNQETVALLERAAKVLPDDFRVNFYLGIAYTRALKNLDAVRVLEHARQLDPKNIGAISQLALIYDGMKKYDESDRLYEEALKIEPQNHLVLNNFGYSLADRGVQIERALEMAKKAVEAQPDNTSYLDTIGWVYYRLGQYDKALIYVKRAVEKGEVSAVVYEHLGDIYFRLNEKERALEQWNAALKLDGKNSALREKIVRGTP